MTRVRPRGEEIRHYILENTEKYSTEISKITAEHFKITRQAVNKHLQRLVRELSLTETGQTRNRSYKLATLVEWQKHYSISTALAEDVAWTEDVAPVLGRLPENVIDIWHYAFTEMLNNAISHSGGTEVRLRIAKTAINTVMVMVDNGVGIFKNIQTKFNLLDERHAVLELSKGKLTTDPKHHSGEGIFFASRMCDNFSIISDEVRFMHSFGNLEDWVYQQEGDSFHNSTAVVMRLDNHTSRTVKKIFDQYTSGDDYGFNKTVVPVRLAQYGNDKLISRSQAKRVLERVDLFKVVLFDFTGLNTIGQAFADEIFRVFHKNHPEIEMHAIHANSEVKRMISRAGSLEALATAALAKISSDKS
jgi:anti-sigma regulatory factor (Ser/Thr protein kinase)